MDKKREIGFILIHLLWTLSWSIGVYYVECGMLTFYMNGTPEQAISTNAACGAILFLIFYLIEKKLIEKGITRTSWFLIFSYVLPTIFQIIMMIWVTNNYQGDKTAVWVVLMFTVILLGMGLFFRGMLGVVNYYRIHIRDKRTRL